MNRIRLIIILLVICWMNIYTQVTHLKTYYDGEGGIEGLKYPNDLVIDPLCKDLYIVGSSTLTHLRTNDSLTFHSFVEKQTANTYEGLTNVNEIISSTNNTFFYLTGDNELLFFIMNDSTKKLVYQQSIKSDENITIGYANSSNISISHDNKNLYLSTNYMTYNDLLIFKIDSISGTLIHKSTFKDLPQIRSMGCSYDNYNLYTCLYSPITYDTAIHVYQRIIENDSLELIQLLSNKDSISAPTILRLSRDNKNVYIYGNKSIVVFNRNQTDGSLTFNQKIYISELFNGFWFAHDMLLSEDNLNLYLSGEYTISVFSRDTISGQLNFIQVIKEGEDGFTGFNTVKSIHLSNDEKYLYATSKYNDALVLFKRNISTGILTYFKQIKNEQGKITGLDNASNIFGSYNDNFIYVLEHQIMGIFYRDLEGYLVFNKNVNLSDMITDIYGISTIFSISPDSKYIYIPSEAIYALRIFERDSATGDITFYKSYDTNGIEDSVVIRIKATAISPDFNNLYAATQSHIIIYDIEKDSGDLTYFSNIEIDENSTNGLRRINYAEVSPDGKNVYFCSSSQFYPDGITVYDRNIQNGSISFIETVISGENGINNLHPVKLLITKDNKFLYTIGPSIHCFKRDTTNGKLTFFEEINIEDLGFQSVYKLSDAILSTDERAIIGLTRQGKAILSFYRNHNTGELKFKEIKYYSNESDYLDGPKVYMSLDTMNIYIISDYDMSLSVYKTNIPVYLDEITHGCMGDTVHLEVDEGYKYYWSTGDTINITNVDSEGVYSIYVEDRIGRIGWDTTRVILHELPDITLRIDNSFAIPDTIFIVADISGSLPYSYLWNDSSTMSYLIVEKAKMESAEELYSLTVYDKYGCINSDTIMITYDDFTNIKKFENSVFMIYPNPVRDILYLKHKKSINDNITIKIFNIKGGMIKDFKVNKSKYLIEVDISELIPGYYICNIRSDSVIKQIVLIKQ